MVVGARRPEQEDSLESSGYFYHSIRNSGELCETRWNHVKPCGKFGRKVEEDLWKEKSVGTCPLSGLLGVCRKERNSNQFMSSCTCPAEIVGESRDSFLREAESLILCAVFRMKLISSSKWEALDNFHFESFRGAEGRRIRMRSLENDKWRTENSDPKMASAVF